jgi:hypothetical protein
MDRDTEALLRTSLRAELSEPGGRSLDARLAELGWDDVIAEDAATARSILFEVKGEVLSEADTLGPLLSAVAASVGGLAQAEGAAVVLPMSLSATPSCSLVDGSVHVEGVALRVPEADSLIVPVAGEDGARLAMGPAQLQSSPLGGMDPDLGLVRVTGAMRAAEVAWAGVDVWDAMVAAGRWATAVELNAIADRVVVNAVDYTKERHQYGRPIGSFQALQHRLAAAHASVVGAGNVAREAAQTGDGWTALVAKYLAGRAAEDACTQAQQSYGAIGFTWEHDFHRSLRRVYLLDRLFGGWRELEVEIGSTLRRTGKVPKIGHL